MQEYIKRMRLKNDYHIDEQEISDVYQKNKDQLIIDFPLLKGYLIRIKKEEPGIEELKRIMISKKEEDLDKLENEWVPLSESYIYFKDKWVSVYDLKENFNLEINESDDFQQDSAIYISEGEGYITVLHVTDYLPSGSIEPYDFAHDKIKESLEMDKLSRYEEDLINDLIDKAIKENKLLPVNYNPVL